MIEPRAEHVIQVTDFENKLGEEKAAGEGNELMAADNRLSHLDASAARDLASAIIESSLELPHPGETGHTESCSLAYYLQRYSGDGW